MMICARGMKIGVLNLDEDAGEDALETFNGRNLEVEQFSTPCGYLSGNAIANFLGSLKSVKDVLLDLQDDLCDSYCWVDLAKNQRMLRTLHLNQNASNDSKAELSDVVHAVAMHCPAMQSLELAFCDHLNDSTMVLLAQRCTQLTNLDIRGINTLTDKTLQALGKHCPRLVTLCLSHVSNGALTDTGFVPLVKGCTKLSQFTLWDYSRFTERSMAALAPIAHQITRLELPRCSAFGKGSAAACFRLLTTLDLSDCTGIPEQVLIIVVQNNPLLEYVTLTKVATVTDSVVAALAQCCAALAYVHLEGCVKVTDVSPLSCCAKLYMLDISDCTRVTEASQVQLREAHKGLRIYT